MEEGLGKNWGIVTPKTASMIGRIRGDPLEGVEGKIALKTEVKLEFFSCFEIISPF